MARSTYDVLVDLDRIICHDEADGCGVAEPYLWAAFFRIGGDDVTIVLDGIDSDTSPPTAIVHLEGSPSMQFGSGSHGNLGTRDVDAGDTVNIPETVGQFEARLKPIPIPESLKDLADLAGIEVPDDLPGFVGIVVVLMEEDNVTDDGAEAGHRALNDAIQAAIQQVIDTRSIENPGVSDEDIQGLTDGISDKISDAISEQQSFFENIWSWLNPDDQIGKKVFLFNTDDLHGKTSIPLEERWENEGDWEIKGELIPTLICPADAVAATLDALFGSTRTFTYDRKSLSHFRDHEFLKYRSAFRWWKRLQATKSQIVSMMIKDKDFRDLLFDMFVSAQKLVKSPDRKIPLKDINNAIRFVKVLSNSKKRRTQIDAIRAKDFIKRCKGKTVREVLKLMNVHPPSRYH
jgi:hypothetical protein